MKQSKLLTSGEVERRFKQSDFLIIENLESLLINSANGENVAPSESLFNYLEGDVDKDRFITQLTDMMEDSICP